MPVYYTYHGGIHIEFRITNIPTGGRKFEIREEERGHFIRIPYNSLGLFMMAIKPMIDINWYRISFLMFKKLAHTILLVHTVCKPHVWSGSYSHQWFYRVHYLCYV